MYKNQNSSDQDDIEKFNQQVEHFSELNLEDDNEPFTIDFGVSYASHKKHHKSHSSHHKSSHHSFSKHSHHSHSSHHSSHGHHHSSHHSHSGHHSEHSHHTHHEQKSEFPIYEVREVNDKRDISTSTNSIQKPKISTNASRNVSSNAPRTYQGEHFKQATTTNNNVSRKYQGVNKAENLRKQPGNTPKKQNKKRKKKKTMSKSKKALIVILCIILVCIAGVGGVGLHYLNKINFDDGNLVTAPVNPEGEDAGDGDILNGNLSQDEANSLAGANASINANLNNKEIWYSDHVKNILLMGIDYGSSKFPYGRSDSMIIVSINEATNKVKLISLSRALYSAIDGYANTRLSHAHGYGGAPLAIKAIENNYKIRIDNYASVNFSGFESIIDAVGGVQITLSAAEAKAIRGVLGTSQAGTYNLNGKQALAYARTRYIDTDRDRTGRQRKVLESLANKATSLSVSELISMMDKVLPLVTTDLSRTQLLSYMTKAVTYLGFEREQHVLPHKSSPLVLRGGFEVILVDWADEIPYVHDLFYGDVEAKTISQ